MTRTFARASVLLVTLALPLVCSSQQAGNAQTDASQAEAGSAAADAGPPAEITFPSSVGDVHFPHELHLEFGCVTCHHQIHAADLDTPHPSYLQSSWINCRICHDTSTENGRAYYKCSKCHHSQPSNIADETLSAKVVIHKSCWNCHESGTGVEASAGCGKCHVKER